MRQLSTGFLYIVILRSCLSKNDRLLRGMRVLDNKEGLIIVYGSESQPTEHSYSI